MNLILVIVREGDKNMKYDVDDIVTLDDNKEYYLIDKGELDGSTYYYAILYDKDIDTMLDNNKFCFFKDDNGYLCDVVDLDLMTKLYELFIRRLSSI